MRDRKGKKQQTTTKQTQWRKKKCIVCSGSRSIKPLRLDSISPRVSFSNRRKFRHRRWLRNRCFTLLCLWKGTFRCWISSSRVSSSVSGGGSELGTSLFPNGISGRKSGSLPIGSNSIVELSSELFFLLLSWSWCLRTKRLSGNCTRNETGPVTSTIVSGIHRWPWAKFCAYTLSPVANFLSLAEISWAFFWPSCFEQQCLAWSDPI